MYKISAVDLHRCAMDFIFCVSVFFFGDFISEYSTKLLLMVSKSHHSSKMTGLFLSNANISVHCSVWLFEYYMEERGKLEDWDWHKYTTIYKIDDELVLGCVQLFVTPWTVACQGPLSMGIIQARILEWVAMPSSRGSAQPRDQSQISRTAGRFFTNWATREAQEYWSYTGVGRLSLLQVIFLTQELTWGLFHCRWILYQLSYQGSPDK